MRLNGEFAHKPLAPLPLSPCCDLSHTDTYLASRVTSARKAEEDLHKALRLAAERLSAVSGNEGGTRTELDEVKAKLMDAQMEVAHLRARLFGEKGLVLDQYGGAPAGTKPRADKDDIVIDQLRGV